MDPTGLAVITATGVGGVVITGVGTVGVGVAGIVGGITGVLTPSTLGDGTLPPGIMNKGIDDNTDMTDPATWPKPPVDGECEEGDPSRKKPRDRGERSLWDSEGGEWRPHKPDKHHPEGHWDHKPSGANRPWTNVPIK